MPMPDEFEQKRFDPRIYLGILIFRWKLIVLCFVYCVLGGVLYLEFTPKEYQSRAEILISRDPSTKIDETAYQWQSRHTHVQLLQSSSFVRGIIERLTPRWLPRLAGKYGELSPRYWVQEIPSSDIRLYLFIRNTHPAYARAFLREAIRDFRDAREVVKNESYGSAVKLLQAELANLNDQIRAAEDDVIEYQRINQMEFVQAKASIEMGYLGSLVSLQHQLETEKWMLELQAPKLKGQSPEMIYDAYRLTRRIGGGDADQAATGSLAVSPQTTERQQDVRAYTADAAQGKNSSEAAGPKDEERTTSDMGEAFAESRFRMARLQRQKKELAVYMKPDNPKLKAIDDEIKGILRDIEDASEVQFARLKMRQGAIDVHMSALDEAIRRWKNSYLMASRKTADFRHIQMVVSRLDGRYATLYSKMQDLRIDSEFKAERLTITQPVVTDPEPVWPDAFKILTAVLVAGIGSGLGLALLAYFFDDKVQSVSDVEATVGVPFLGGIPFWVRSDLANRIRPIVSEQHRSGAAEAYRALRTNVLSAVEKTGKKAILITSADSKEGKTLTALNLAIMIARTGKKVLLLDMDLRRGVLHKSFDMERSPGIVDMLRERRPIAGIVVGTPYDNLWFAPAGSVEKSTSELLHAVDLESVLGELLDAYDYVVMDSAPVLRVTDTVILASCPLCCVIYVAHANKTSKPIIKYSLDMLGDVHVIGMIVNSIEMHRISSLYYAYQYPNYAYYSYAYKYGYDYDLYDEHGRGAESHTPWGTARRAVRKWWRKTFLAAE